MPRPPKPPRRSKPGKQARAGGWGWDDRLGRWVWVAPDAPLDPTDVADPDVRRRALRCVPAVGKGVAGEALGPDGWPTRPDRAAVNYRRRRRRARRAQRGGRR